MTTVGERLRKAREAKGLTIAELAKKTHIMSKQLEGIEQDDFSPIPAPIYVKSFIKTFATQVGLDPAEMVALYLEQSKAGENPPAPTPELKVKKSNVRARKNQARAEKEAAKEAALEEARESAEQAALEAEAAKAEKLAKKQARAAQKAQAAAQKAKAAAGKRKSAEPSGLMPIVPVTDAPSEEESTEIIEHQKLLDFGDDTEFEDELVEVEDLEEDLEEDAEDFEEEEDEEELEEDLEDIEIEAPAAAASVSVASRTRSANSASATSPARPKSTAATSATAAKASSQTWQRPEPKSKRPARAPRPPRPALSAVLAAKWKGVKSAFAARFKRSESGFSIFGKTIATATLRKVLTIVLLACCLAGLVYAAVLVADRMELRRAERGSSIGDLRTNPVITDPPDPYFITE